MVSVALGMPSCSPSGPWAPFGAQLPCGYGSFADCFWARSAGISGVRASMKLAA